MSITLLSKILSLASVFSFIDDDFRLVWFILGFVAGADLGMIFAAAVYAAGKDNKMSDLGGVLKFNDENAIHINYDPETDEILVKHWNPSTNEWKTLTTGGDDSMFVIKPYLDTDESNKTYREVAEAFLDGKIVLFVEDVATSPRYGYATIGMVCYVTSDENGEITEISGSNGTYGFTSSGHNLDDKILFYVE